MSSSETRDVVVVGAGVAGLLVARELVAAGREVLVIERGAYKSHAAQVDDGEHSGSIATARPNHEPHPDTPDDPWGYVYGVGGTGLHWGGNTPRFLPADFELHSRYGVGMDWPIGYAELAGYYRSAEEALAIAGAANDRWGATYDPPLPPHRFSPVDRLLRPHLEPYYHLPQARPTRSVGGRPACCGSGTCSLCPVDARFSPLHTLDDGLRQRSALTLRTGHVVARIRSDGARAWALECLDAAGEPSTIGAGTVVLAANGVENAAILLRSQLGGDHVGRWLYDHEHVQYHVEVNRRYRAGVGTTIATGISYAWADGPWRRRRGSQLVYPDNRGLLRGSDFVDAVVDGRRGAALRDDLTGRFERRIVLDAIGEDLPHSGRYVELSTRRDSLGLPLNRLRYPIDSSYLGRSRDLLGADLERRLRPLGARLTETYVYRGGHQLGTCRMGPPGHSVVDADCRLHGAERLYVVGGSAFPSYSAAHPTLTIAALALRLGRYLVDA